MVQRVRAPSRCRAVTPHCVSAHPARPLVVDGTWGSVPRAAVTDAAGHVGVHLPRDLLSLPVGPSRRVGGWVRGWSALGPVRTCHPVSQAAAAQFVSSIVTAGTGRFLGTSLPEDSGPWMRPERPDLGGPEAAPCPGALSCQRCGALAAERIQFCQGHRGPRSRLYVLTFTGLAAAGKPQVLRCPVPGPQRWLSSRHPIIAP